MCTDCGCGERPDRRDEHESSHDHDHPHDHHGHDHHHHHPQPGNGSRTLQVETDVLAQNNLLAQRNRGWFDAKKMLVLNLVSSPGSFTVPRTDVDVADPT